MKETIKILDLDIKKCEESIKINNLLEIAIIIEEMIDKYKNQINNLSALEKNNVWAYKKKDLEDLKVYLENYKNKLTSEYKILALEEVFQNSMSEIEINNSLSIDKKIEVINIIGRIKSISLNEKSMVEKWDELRPYVNYISKGEFSIANNLINLINFVFKNGL